MGVGRFQRLALTWFAARKRVNTNTAQKAHPTLKPDIPLIFIKLL